jgi:hypothetical protein
MMVGKGHLPTNGEPPASEIAKEGIGIAEPAESEEGARPNFRRRKQSDLTPEAAEPN